MNEEFLYFIWENRLFKRPTLETADSKSITLIHPGYRNLDAGPDYLYSKLSIDGQHWVGQVEMHVKSSDWEKHGHHHDPNYHAVILHVVWEHDKEIFIHSPGDLPVLILSRFAIPEYLTTYTRLAQDLALFPCQNQMPEIPDHIKRQWLDRLLVQRLELVSQRVINTFQKIGNDWQECFYIYFVRSFGLRVNSEAFEMLAKSVPYKFIARYRIRNDSLEAVLFGQSGMLNGKLHEPYPILLQKEYQFWKRMLGFHEMNASIFRYHRMHPSAFPSIRIAQLATVLRAVYPISELLSAENSLEWLKQKLGANPNEYWNRHYRFGSPVKEKSAALGDLTIERIILHAIVPVMFAMGRLNAKQELIDRAIQLLNQLKAEENRITKKWHDLQVYPENAGDTQALIHSFKECCSAKKCLSCLIGKQILVRTTTHDTKDI